MFVYIFLEDITIKSGMFTLTAIGVVLSFIIFAWQVGRARKSDLKKIMATKTDKKDFQSHIDLNNAQFELITAKIEESNTAFDKLNDNISGANKEVMFQLNKYSDKIDEYKNHTDERIEGNRKEFNRKLDDHQKQIIGLIKNGK